MEIVNGTANAPLKTESADVSVLLERVRRGDREAFMTLVQRYQQKVFVMSYSILRNKEDALDVVQETFLRLYRKIDTYRPGNNFQGWLLQIAKNLSIDYYRKHTEKRREWEDPRAVDDLPLASGDHEAAERSSDLRGIITRCVERLAERQKMVFIMRHYNGLQFNEISETLRISTGTAKSLHFKAVQNLRKWLSPYLGVPS
jgi:RNA polymerase sigma-70 factor (ECF subfamily)